MTSHHYGGTEGVSPDQDPTYLEHVQQPLAQGEGVACFLTQNPDGEPAVLFLSHTLTDAAERFSKDPHAGVRAAQAIAVQRAARSRATGEGYEPTVP